LRASS